MGWKEHHFVMEKGTYSGRIVVSVHAGMDLFWHISFWR